MDKVEVRVTWGLAWSLWWRWFLISVGMSFVAWLILLVVGATIFLPFL